MFGFAYNLLKDFFIDLVNFGVELTNQLAICDRVHLLFYFYCNCIFLVVDQFALNFEVICRKNFAYIVFNIFLCALDLVFAFYLISA